MKHSLRGQTAVTDARASRCRRIKLFNSCLIVLRSQMSVASRHRNCFVTSKFLHCSQVYVLHDQSADEGMAQVVPAKVLHLGLFEGQFKPSPRVVEITSVL